MSSSEFPKRGRGDEDLSQLYQLEGQRKEAEEIVRRWFRFRARRGIGIFYLVVSLAPVLGTIVGTLFNAEVAGIIVGTSTAVFAWFCARRAGAQSFGRMTRTMKLLEEDPTQNPKPIASNPVIFLLQLWPWIPYVVTGVLGLPLFEIFFALVWLVENVLFRVLVLSRNKNPILCQRVEDWLATLSVPIIAIIPALSQLGILPQEPPFSAFLLITPLFLVAGVKSLYDAPKELVGNHDD
jgi:hypothetical protein